MFEKCSPGLYPGLLRDQKRLRGDLFHRKELQTAFVFVPFAARRFQVEDQVFQVDVHLAERFLNMGQNPLAAFEAVDQTMESSVKPCPIFHRQLVDHLEEIDQFADFIRRIFLRRQESRRFLNRRRRHYVIGHHERSAFLRPKGTQGGPGGDGSEECSFNELLTNVFYNFS